MKASSPAPLMVTISSCAAKARYFDSLDTPAALYSPLRYGPSWENLAPGVPPARRRSRVATNGLNRVGTDFGVGVGAAPAGGIVADRGLPNVNWAAGGVPVAVKSFGGAKAEGAGGVALGGASTTNAGVAALGAASATGSWTTGSLEGARAGGAGGVVLKGAPTADADAALDAGGTTGSWATGLPAADLEEP